MLNECKLITKILYLVCAHLKHQEEEEVILVLWIYKDRSPAQTVTRSDFC